MGRQKKSQENTENLIEEKKVLTVKEKYMQYCLQSRSNYVTGISQQEIMEILRYCEKKVGHNIPLNSSCNGCLINIIKLLDKIG